MLKTALIVVGVIMGVGIGLIVYLIRILKKHKSADGQNHK